MEPISPGGPPIQILQREGEPLRLFWNPPRARLVVIRHSESGALAWRASAGPGRLGPQSAVLAAPLAVRAMGPPPGVYPPDGRGAEADTPELRAGETYTVTVASRVPSGGGTDRPTCTASDTLTVAFPARFSSVP